VSSVSTPHPDAGRLMTILIMHTANASSCFLDWRTIPYLHSFERAPWETPPTRHVCEHELHRINYSHDLLKATRTSARDGRTGVPLMTVQQSSCPDATHTVCRVRVVPSVTCGLPSNRKFSVDQG